MLLCKVCIKGKSKNIEARHLRVRVLFMAQTFAGDGTQDWGGSEDGVNDGEVVPRKIRNEAVAVP
jgi:hypothetical protein